LFVKVVKTTFNQRRKTIRNSIKPMLTSVMDTTLYLFEKRPEQLSVAEFVELTKLVAPHTV
jgi:16S rRNA (adenine1518-N6/adenine1519-N6)-dimethyltransferase